MAPEAQLLLRHLRSAPGAPGPALFVVNCPGAPAARALIERVPDARVVFFHDDYALHRAVRDCSGKDAGRIASIFAAWHDPGDEKYPSGIVFLPRERALLEMTLIMAAAALRRQAPVWLTGSIRGGARSARAPIERFLGAVKSTRAARHSVLYLAETPASAALAAGLDGFARDYAFDFLGNTVNVVSLPGVFSHARLDPGTRLLLDTVASLKPGGARVLDFGCGSGAVGTALGLAWRSAKIDMVDSSARALEASRRTLAANGLDPGLAKASDAFSDVTDRYDLILSNPPFHSGAATDRRAVEGLVREASSHLLPGGRLRLVANHFLKYGPLLKAGVGNASVVAEDASYRVHEALALR